MSDNSEAPTFSKIKIQPKNSIIDQLNMQLHNKTLCRKANVNKFELNKSGNLGFLMEISEDDQANSSLNSQISKTSLTFGQSANSSNLNNDKKSSASKKR